MAAIVVGNPKAKSRTLVVAEAVLGSLLSLSEEGPPATVIDLAEHATRIFDWHDEELGDLTSTVARSDLLVVASPTYKASYTGLLKAFFDRYGTNGLAGVVAVPVMVGAAPMHALAPEVHLRPLLVELGATVPCRSLYVLESEMDRLDDVVTAWAAYAKPLVDAARVLG
jgi:FMN reductase